MAEGGLTQSGLASLLWSVHIHILVYVIIKRYYGVLL